MGPLKKITYDCKKATFLIEKKLIGQISLREQLELRYHLLGCGVCRLYQKQSSKIQAMVHQLFHSPQGQNVTLDDNFKKELSDRIEEELNKN